MNRFLVRLLPLAVCLPALWLLSGCAGAAAVAPTAIPASVVRPLQSTPAYAVSADTFALLTPAASPQFAPTAASNSALELAATDNSARIAIQLYMRNQTPSAVGIAPAGAAIYAERGGRALASVPVGGVLTVTGKSADGAWYAVYNDDAAYGWTPAGQLRVYGGEDLVVVEEAPDPAPIATLLAQAAQPVRVLDDLLAQMEATLTPQATRPPATPQPPPVATDVATDVAADVAAGTQTPVVRAVSAPPQSGPQTVAAGNAQTGIVISDGRLNLRTQPQTTAAIVRKLDPGDEVTIVERSADGAWLQVQLADGSSGWVAAEFIAQR